MWLGRLVLALIDKRCACSRNGIAHMNRPVKIEMADGCNKGRERILAIQPKRKQSQSTL